MTYNEYKQIRSLGVPARHVKLHSYRGWMRAIRCGAFGVTELGELMFLDVGGRGGVTSLIGSKDGLFEWDDAEQRFEYRYHDGGYSGVYAYPITESVLYTAKSIGDFRYVDRLGIRRGYGVYLPNPEAQLTERLKKLPYKNVVLTGDFGYRSREQWEDYFNKQAYKGHAMCVINLLNANTVAVICGANGRCGSMKARGQLHGIPIIEERDVLSWMKEVNADVEKAASLKKEADKAAHVVGMLEAVLKMWERKGL